MKCTNKFCYWYNKNKKHGCSYYKEGWINNCVTKNKWDKYLLVNGIIEIENEEVQND